MYAVSKQLLLCCLVSIVSSHVVPHKRSTVEPYAPFTTTCPSQLIRGADSLSEGEKEYIKHRQPKAAEALWQWLGDTLGCEYVERWDMPKLAIALSGGGPKAGLTTAGFVYALDGRDSSDSVSGLLQGSVYISALSGGTLTLAGMMANDFSLISTLKSQLYNANYQNPFVPAISDNSLVLADVNNKTLAGYPTSLVDIYGRAIALDFTQGPPQGGDEYLWSNVTLQPSFQQYGAPYPIMTVSNSDVAGGMCFPEFGGPIWEVTPLEFGSWDPEVNAFTPTQYMGTSLVNGVPSNGSGCTAGFDNTGLISAISSNILVNEGANNCTTGNTSTNTLNALAGTIAAAFSSADILVNPYGIVPNPFYQSSQAGKVKSQQNLYMTDGGFVGQGIPIFPWLQPERDIDVIFVVDTESAGSNNITNGQSVYDTAMSAQMKGLSKMPAVPTPEQFAAQNLSSRAQFYGCHNESVTTMIFFPNTNETALPGSAFFFSPTDIDATFYGGAGMATQYGAEDWPTCLACGILHKKHWRLPDECSQCLDKYCWNP